MRKITLLNQWGKRIEPLNIRAFSDIHLEFENTFRIPNLQENQVIILAGDICSQGRQSTLNKDLESFLIDTLKYKTIVIFVSGNHEYWGTTIPKFNKLLRDFENKNSNFFFLDNESLFINDIEFIGGTLWTDLNKQDPLTYLEIGGSKSYGKTANTSKDYHKIKKTSIFQGRECFSKIHTKDTVLLHNKTLSYIKSRIGFKHTQVVITHHAPSEKFVDKKRFESDKKNGYKYEINKYSYYSELDEIASNFNYWIAGHTHLYVNEIFNGVHYLSFPRGYVDKNKTEQKDSVIPFYTDYIIKIY